MSFDALPVDAVYAAFGEAISYDPDGHALSVRAIRRSPDEMGDYASVRWQARVVTLEIRVAEIAAGGLTPAQDDLLALADGERRVVKSVTVADPARLIWILDTQPEIVE